MTGLTILKIKGIQLQDLMRNKEHARRNTTWKSWSYSKKFSLNDFKSGLYDLFLCKMNITF